MATVDVQRDQPPGDQDRRRRSAGPRAAGGSTRPRPTAAGRRSRSRPTASRPAARCRSRARSRRRTAARGSGASSTCSAIEPASGHPGERVEHREQQHDRDHQAEPVGGQDPSRTAQGEVADVAEAAAASRGRQEEDEAADDEQHHQARAAGSRRGPRPGSRPAPRRRRTGRCGRGRPRRSRPRGSRRRRRRSGSRPRRRPCRGRRPQRASGSRRWRGCAASPREQTLMTVPLTSSTRYSGGAPSSGRRVEHQAQAAADARRAPTPLRTLLPHSTVSGRSVVSRTVTAGTPMMQHSSCTVPLSVSTQRASRSSATKSKKPNGSYGRSASSSRLSPKALEALARARVDAEDQRAARAPRRRRAPLGAGDRSRSSKSTVSWRWTVSSRYPPASRPRSSERRRGLDPLGVAVHHLLDRVAGDEDRGSGGCPRAAGSRGCARCTASARRWSGR